MSKIIDITDKLNFISIHTLRVEGDSKSIQSEKALAFYH